MHACVLIPWRSTDCPHRIRALAHVRATLRQPVAVGRCDTGPWVKATAIADALRQTTAEVLILHDADVVAPGLPDAVAKVMTGAPWAIPHRGVLRLTEAATARYLLTGESSGLELSERAYLGVEGGGVVVVHRDVYTACPLDPRFTGWGSEDDSWGMALRTLHGPPMRARAPLIHLFHPAQERASRTYGSEASRMLRKRYSRAQLHPPAMTALLEEANACRSPLC